MKTSLLLSLARSALLAGPTFAGECRRCGGCEKVCKLVCTTRTIEKTCYGCECEDVCIPGPSKKCQEHCEPVGRCDLLCCLRWIEWSPRCAKPTHRKYLTKYIVTREVPSYQWGVVCACQAGGQGGSQCCKSAPPDANAGDEYSLTDEELNRLTAETERQAPLPMPRWSTKYVEYVGSGRY